MGQASVRGGYPHLTVHAHPAGLPVLVGCVGDTRRTYANVGNIARHVASFAPGRSILPFPLSPPRRRDFNYYDRVVRDSSLPFPV
jgi:hypothetical protein